VGGLKKGTKGGGGKDFTSGNMRKKSGMKNKKERSIKGGEGGEGPISSAITVWGGFFPNTTKSTIGYVGGTFAKKPKPTTKR